MSDLEFKRFIYSLALCNTNVTMKRILPTIYFLFILSVPAFSQCTTTNATSCVCPGGGSNCDLLPDIKVSVDALQGSYTVYTQTGNAASGSQGSNDGRLRLTG